MNVYKINKAPTWAEHLEQAWTWVPYLQECDPSKRSHVSGMLLPDLVWEARLAPKGLSQARYIFKHGTTLCLQWSHVPTVPLCFADGSRTFRYSNFFNVRGESMVITESLLAIVDTTRPDLQLNLWYYNRYYLPIGHCPSQCSSTFLPLLLP